MPSYFYVNTAAGVSEREDTGSWQDEALRKAGNRFADRRRAEQAAEAFSALLRLYRL